MTRTERLVLVIAVLSSFVTFLDSSVINVALPAIARELGGGLTVQQWIVDAYLLTLGSLILLAGSLSDVFGRVVILRAGLIGFGLSSLLIACAPTAEFVIVLRAIQGIAGALLVPSSLALIMSTFRGPAQSRAIGLWTAWTSAAFLAGPIVGGVFVDYLSWRLVFAINVLPIVATLLLLVLLGRLGHSDTVVAGRHIDYPGAILGILGLGGPVFALIEQSTFGWGSPLIYLTFGLGVLSFVAFLWWQSRARMPMLPLALFRVRNFSVGNLTTALVYGALSMGGFVIVVYLQQVAHFPATVAALAFLPVSIVNVLLSSLFGTLSGRYGPRLFMSLGPVVAGLGYLLLLTTARPVNYWLEILPGIVLFALGLTMTVAPLTAAILGSIAAAQSGIGSAVNNAVARVAGLLGTAALGLVLGGTVDLAGFHRVLVVVAVLLIGGGIVSLLGIRNPSKDALVGSPAEPAGDAAITPS